MRPTALFVILLSLLGGSQCSDHYTVVLPRIIRSNSEYKVAVSAHDTEKPITFKVKLSGPSLEQDKSLEVKPFTSEILKFEIPTLTGEEYNLKVVGSGGVEFEKESKLTVSQKQASVLIQTDKALYKPGDLVRYRVLLLDENTRPAVIKGPIDIQISYDKQNIIKELKGVNTTKGVYTGELQLSAVPILGKWHINVDINGNTKSKEFSVEEYVLPRFQVFVEAEKHAFSEFGTVRATIRARYTYGKPVKGVAEITVKTKDDKESGYGETRKIVAIDGRLPILLEVPYNRATATWNKRMVIEAVVTDKLTGHTQHGSDEFIMYKNTYCISEVDGNPYSYEPGVPVEIKARVTYTDGTPVTDSKYPFKISVQPGYGAPKVNETEYTLDNNGIAKANLTFPDISYVLVWGSYPGTEHYFGYLERRRFTAPVTPANYSYAIETPLQAHIKTEKPSLNNDIEIEVTSQKDMDHLLYQIIGRGNILVTNMIKEIPNKKRYTFSFKPTMEMIPTAHLFVQSIRDGELIWHETTIEFEENLKNKISLEAAEQAKPGEDVNIKVKTSPNAYVGLLGVDQSVIILRHGNDLSKGDVFRQLREYTHEPDYNRYDEPGNEAGLITFTNANYTLSQRYIDDVIDSGGSELSNCFVISVPMSTGAANYPTTEPNIGHRPKPTLRKEYPETWIWDLNDTLSGPNGELLLQKKVPDTITSWIITGFSMHDENGLGLTDDPTKLTVFQPFFVSTNLPYSVKRGEVIAIPVIVFNYLNKSLDTAVTMENLDEEFDFIEAPNEDLENPQPQVKRTKRLTVPGQSGETVTFMIRPKTLGHISIKVGAISALAGDMILKMLPVVPEGDTE